VPVSGIIRAVAAPEELSVPGREAFEATRGILRGGRILAVVLLAAPVFRALSEGGSATVKIASLYAVIAVALWAVTTWIQSRLLFGRNLRLHARRGNGAAAAATAANQIAIALSSSREQS
jgi:hypothetical protein